MLSDSSTSSTVRATIENPSKCSTKTPVKLKQADCMRSSASDHKFRQTAFNSFVWALAEEPKEQQASRPKNSLSLSAVQRSRTLAGKDQAPLEVCTRPFEEAQTDPHHLQNFDFFGILVIYCNLITKKAFLELQPCAGSLICPRSAHEPSLKQ